MKTFVLHCADGDVKVITAPNITKDIQKMIDNLGVYTKDIYDVGEQLTCCPIKNITFDNFGCGVTVTYYADRKYNYEIVHGKFRVDHDIGHVYVDPTTFYKRFAKVV